MPIRLNSPRLVKQPTGLFQSLRNSLGRHTRRLLGEFALGVIGRFM